MGEISVEAVTEEVARMCQEANYDLGEDVEQALIDAIGREESPVGRGVLEQLVENARIARRESVPMCQDCGLAVLFVDVGQDAEIVGGSLADALVEGVRRGYKDGYLRASMLDGPLTRKNTGDNTPPMIHWNVVPGDQVTITLSAKGGGSENMSRQAMLKPAQGWAGVREFVVETVEKAGANPCPPIIVGVGIGGNFEFSAILAKRALTRHIGDYSPDPEIANMERELLELCNATGVGPQGLGGTVTALWVMVETRSCHIASLPVAVNIQCHAQRHRTVTLG